MSAPTIMHRAQTFLAERRRLGFQARNPGYALISFARFVERRRHHGPLTVALMAESARRDKARRRTAGTWARRLKILRPFARWMRQFEPRTAVPDESIFGPVPGRVAPHIYRDEEIVALLVAARALHPKGGLRPATFEAVFGLLASTGLRVSEALALRDADVDLTVGTLTVRRTKFAKSRLVPLHWSTVEALAHYRQRRCRATHTSAQMPFFISSRGRLLGRALGQRQVHRVFIELRDRFGWANRGATDGPRLHQLRHSFVVKRMLLWRRQGIDLDQAMLSLSTYLGHAKISSTYWYLSAVPELMALVGNRFERFVAAPGALDE